MRREPSRRTALVACGVAVLGLLGVWLLPHPSANGQERAAGPQGQGSVPEGAGLAAKYPGDEGIERDPQVVFVEDFETGSVQEIAARWGDVLHPANMDLPEDIHASSPGRRSLHISKNGHLYTHTKGVDRLHARFYVKFHPRTGYVGHFVNLIADRVPTPWPRGGAGKKPAGDQGFSTGIEPWGKGGEVPPPGVWHFYTYWHEMKPDGWRHFWGNHFDAPQDPVQPGRWYCVEAMVKCNSTPEATDGEQAFWVDGKLIGYFKGIRWRTSDKLKINTFWLSYYVPEQAAKPDRVYEVWFDDVVLATEYVGPVQGKPKGGKRVATPSKSALLTPGLLLPPPGKVVFSESFEGGRGKFDVGEVVEGGVNGSRALAFPPQGVAVWKAFSTTVQDSTTIRFKLKGDRPT
ncbi:MAG: hypothetical protein FJ290_01470 [Planctomycetes bacterium]|nr:hypothetical protein [Planctomycetota bacterium]